MKKPIEGYGLQVLHIVEVLTQEDAKELTHHGKHVSDSKDLILLVHTSKQFR